MSYASLAGLPLSFGLYGALVPCLVFMLFSTSRQLVRWCCLELCGVNLVFASECTS